MNGVIFEAIMGALDLKNKWVLVTGASSGLGKEMAVQLARDFYANLIIVARRTSQLEELQQKLEKTYNVQVKVCTADLSQKDEVHRVFDFTTTEVDLHAAILNAGVTYFGEDHLLPDTNLECIIQTNVSAMAMLMQRFARHFDESGKERGLLLISSMAAMSPVPYQALYSGTKAFVYAYGQALSAELVNPNCSISIFAPAGIQTEMTATANFHGLEKWLMPVDKVAYIALTGFVNRRLVIVPGFANKLSARLLPFVPKRFLLKQLGKLYRKALTQS